MEIIMKKNKKKLNAQIQDGFGKKITLKELIKLFPDGVCFHNVSIYEDSFCQACEDSPDKDKITL